MVDSTTSGRPKKPWTALRILKWSIAALVLTLVVFVVGGIGVLEFMQRPLHKPSFLVRLTVDMQVNNEAVRFDRILRCSTFVNQGGRDLSDIMKGRPTSHAVEVGAIGKRLSDGSAVMMWTPYYCAHKRYGQTGKLVAEGPPEIRIPFMGWTPDADTLDKLEIYPSPAYFTKPYARIKNVRVRIESAPDNARADKPDEFEWFTQSVLRDEDRPRGHSARFIGFTKRTLAETEWKNRIPEFDKIISALRKPTAFGFKSAYQSDQTKIDFNTTSAYSAAGDIFFRVFKPWPDLLQQRSAVEMNYYFQRHVSQATYPLLDARAISAAQPLAINQNTIIVKDTNQSSYYTLYNENKHNLVSINYEIDWKLKNNGKSIICEKCFYYYDPNSKELTQVYTVPYQGRPVSRDSRWEPPEKLTTTPRQRMSNRKN